jgi:hypothetical protein
MVPSALATGAGTGDWARASIIQHPIPDTEATINGEP